MKPGNLAAWIEAAARRALRGQAPAPLRRCSFTFDEAAKRIILRFEVDRPHTKDEREDFDVVETEMYAERFFDDKETIDTVVEVVPPTQPLGALPGGVAYVRSKD